MKPLQPIALGLLVVVLSVPIAGYDLLAGPLGWLLVVGGASSLPEGFERRGLVVGLAWTAALVSVPLWVPALEHRVEDADAALGWALGLPAIAFAALLCQGLAAAARADRDRLPAALLRLGVTLNLVVAVLPVLVFGAGYDALRDPAAAAAALTVLAIVVLLLLYADRPWSRVEADAPSTDDA